MKKYTAMLLLALALTQNTAVKAVTVSADNFDMCELPLATSDTLEAESFEGSKYANGLLAVYATPNVLGEKLSEFKDGDEIPYYDVMANGWYRINVDGDFGYVAGENLRTTKDVPKTENKTSKNSRAVPGKTMTFKLSYYTDLAIDNGGWTVTASGKTLKYGMVASNVYPIGTKIYLEGYGEMVVEDRGGSHFNSYDRLDVFIPRNPGESDTQYRARLRKLGRTEVTGWVIK